MNDVIVKTSAPKIAVPKDKRGKGKEKAVSPKRTSGHISSAATGTKDTVDQSDSDVEVYFWEPMDGGPQPKVTILKKVGTDAKEKRPKFAVSFSVDSIEDLISESSEESSSEESSEEEENLQSENKKNLRNF